MKAILGGTERGQGSACGQVPGREDNLRGKDRVFSSSLSLF
jgi:hypothetical protein